MNIEQVRQARKSAEDAIYALLQEFHKETGLHIMAVEVKSLQSHQFRVARPEVVSQEITVEIEQI